jgi:hypothetical protein
VNGHETTQARYERIMAEVLKFGWWLGGEQAAALPDDEWEERFDAYRERLKELRRIIDELRRARP